MVFVKRKVFKLLAVFLFMADKIQMPSGMGGLVRYFDEYQSKIVMSPKFVVFLIALVIILEIGLHMFFA